MRNTASLLITCAALALAVEGQGQAAMPPAARTTIDALLDTVVAREIVPGLGVAIVRDGRIIYQRGVGWADRETKRPVDATTIFYIASCTKSFTALATTLLDRAGVLKLDATIAGILPDAPLAAGLDASKISVRQLLTHTHGIAGDGPVSYRAAYSGEIERPAMLRALAAHGPASTGTAFSYSNLGYNVLSLAIDRIAMKPWQDVLAERVFRPLGLTSTSARVSDLPANRLAMPYRAEPEGIARLPYAKQDANMQAAGGMMSTTGDLARYIAMIMDAGVVDGRRVFPADVIAETQKVHARFSARSGVTERHGYSLGWNHATLDGEALVQHGGGFPGFTASLSFMPAHRLGVIVLGNGAFSGQVQDLVMGYAYALLRDNEAETARYQQQVTELPARVEQERKAIAADRARRAARPQTTALPFTAYVGRYTNPVWGSLVVTLRDGRIHVRNGVIESVAEVFDGAKNMLRVELTGGGTVLEFLATDGQLTGVTYNGARFDRIK